MDVSKQIVPRSITKEPRHKAPLVSQGELNGNVAREVGKASGHARSARDHLEASRVQAREADERPLGSHILIAAVVTRSRSVRARVTPIDENAS